jgi:hypothetical protein
MRPQDTHKGPSSNCRPRPDKTLRQPSGATCVPATGGRIKRGVAGAGSGLEEVCRKGHEPRLRSGPRRIAQVSWFESGTLVRPEPVVPQDIVSHDTVIRMTIDGDIVTLMSSVPVVTIA